MFVECCFFVVLICPFVFIMQIPINQGVHNYASTQRVVSKMASIAWVVERAIPLLKKKPAMGRK